MSKYQISLNQSRIGYFETTVVEVTLPGNSFAEVSAIAVAHLWAEPDAIGVEAFVAREDGLVIDEPFFAASKF